MAAGTMFQPRAVPQPGPIPIEVASQKYPMFAGAVLQVGRDQQRDGEHHRDVLAEDRPAHHREERGHPGQPARQDPGADDLDHAPVPPIELALDHRLESRGELAGVVLHQVDHPSHGDGPDQVPDERQDPEPDHRDHNRGPRREERGRHRHVRALFKLCRALIGVRGATQAQEPEGGGFDDAAVADDGAPRSFDEVERLQRREQAR